MAVTIIDVRSPVEFGICHLPGSISTDLVALFRRILIKVIKDVPIVEFVADPTTYSSSNIQHAAATVVVCRLGNDSQIAANALRDCVRKSYSVPGANSAREDEEHKSSQHKIVDLVGGLRKWSEEADSSFPVY